MRATHVSEGESQFGVRHLLAGVGLVMAGLSLVFASAARAGTGPTSGGSGERDCATGTVTVTAWAKHLKDGGAVYQGPISLGYGEQIVASGVADKGSITLSGTLNGVPADATSVQVELYSPTGRIDVFVDVALNGCGASSTPSTTPSSTPVSTPPTTTPPSTPVSTRPTHHKPSSHSTIAVGGNGPPSAGAHTGLQMIPRWVLLALFAGGLALLIGSILPKTRREH